MSSEVTGTNSGPEEDGETGNRDGQGRNPAPEILQKYQDEKWGSVNDLVENSIIKDYETIECTKIVEKYITYNEEEMIHEVPVTQAERMNIESQYADMTAEHRDEFVPADFEEGMMDFARPETERVNPCSECNGNGRLRCGRCSGSGQNQCGSCNGSGTNYDNSQRCSRCGGSGTQVCSKCDGGGTVACGTCEQKGETWKMDFVRREFTPHEEITAEAPDVPDDFVTSADGTFVETEEESPHENEIRRETDFYDVDAEKVNYVYDDKDYELVRIDGEEVKAKSYPKNQARRLLPYVGAVVGVVILGIILWQTGAL